MFLSITIHQEISILKLSKADKGTTTELLIKRILHVNYYKIINTDFLPCNTSNHIHCKKLVKMRNSKGYYRLQGNNALQTCQSTPGSSSFTTLAGNTSKYWFLINLIPAQNGMFIGQLWGIMLLRAAQQYDIALLDNIGQISLITIWLVIEQAYFVLLSSSQL